LAKERELKKRDKIPLLKLAVEAPKGYKNSTLFQYPKEGRINLLQVKVVSVQVIGKILSLMFKILTSGTFLKGVVFHYKKFHITNYRVGKEVFIRGKVERSDYGLQIINPIIQNNPKLNEIVPIYCDSVIAEGILQYVNYENLKNYGIPYRIINPILKMHRYPDDEVVSYLELHNEFPPDILYSLKFIEALDYITKTRKNIIEYPPLAKLNGDVDSWINSLPFKLTNDQLKVIREIEGDLRGDIAMRRVVVGDVGSGKTMVILASMVMAYPQKSVLMAPTSILSEQLFEEAKKFLPSNFKIKLLTSKTSKKEKLDDFDVLIGTNAILYRELPLIPLVMVDEQHRFGTRHRKKLEELVGREGKRPHFLQLSATPIPRTQAMINGAFVKTSLIEEIPFKKEIETKLIFSKEFPQLLEKIKSEIEKNHQILIIYPLVEESEKINYLSLEEAEEYWKSNFEDVYITHGKDKEKERVLKEFRDRGKILLATTVVEVGISLPRLTIIVIVGAERLGLATLHQLRGRVGRTGLKSYCYLYTKSKEERVIKRLVDFSKTTNGFDIASMDLENRKSGDIIRGAKQSGNTFQWLDLGRDRDVIEDVLNELKIQ